MTTQVRLRLLIQNLVVSPWSLTNLSKSLYESGSSMFSIMRLACSSKFLNLGSFLSPWSSSWEWRRGWCPSGEERRLDWWSLWLAFAGTLLEWSLLEVERWVGSLLRLGLAELDGEYDRGECYFWYGTVVTEVCFGFSNCEPALWSVVT